MEERRKSKRYDIHQMIEMSRNSESFRCEGVNISESGLLVRIDKKVEQTGTEEYLFIFDIELEEGMEEMRYEGKIVYTIEQEGKQEVGIQFVGLNDEESELLQKYTRYLEKQG